MAEVEYLSQAAFDKLSNELKERSTTRRDDIVKRIAQARDEGDLKENGGYHAARDEQGKNEARIKELEYRLENAEIGTPTDANQDGVLEVSPGMLIEAKLSTSSEVLKFILGSRENAEPGIDAFSPSAPLGAAIMGAQAGDTRSYKAPTGQEIEVNIISVTPYI
ncbi:MAG: transcription elongation factor GreA [Candidatus Ancillula sp.]|jgi:transcription elongation factor GreA|nr:transcription elongation factor GreA [Candidatus Ancillula sp.]